MRPTHGYRVHLHNGWLIDLQAEGMWPMGTRLEFTVTTLVIGPPRRVVVQRCSRADGGPLFKRQRQDVAAASGRHRKTGTTPYAGKREPDAGIQHPGKPAK